MKMIKKFAFALVLTSLVITLFGCTTTNQGYTITFNTNGGESINKKTNITAGTKVELPEPTREGYNFFRWYTDPELSFENSVSDSIVVNSDITLYAGWNGKFYYIYYSSEVPLTLEYETAQCGSELSLQQPTNEYKKFVGWYEDETQFDETLMPARDLYLKAKWETLTYTVEFNTNGGVIASGINLLTDVASGSNISLPVPEKDGAIFKGWYTELEGVNEFNEFSRVNSNLVLYAIYDEIANYEEFYNISYNLNNGTLPNNAPLTYPTGTGVTLPIPTRDGYEFKGWYTTSIFTRDEVKAVSSSEFGDKVFYAKWKEVKSVYTITYMGLNNQFISNENVNANSTTQKPSLPTSDISVDWYLGNEIFDFSTPINEDITLYAKWVVLSEFLHTLIPATFDTNKNLPKSISTSLGSISISWATSNSHTLTNTGVTNPARQDEIVNLTATFSYQTNKITHIYPIVVPKIEFDSLANKKAVFAYVYSNMGSFTGFPEAALNTIDVVNYSFARVTSESTVSISSLTKIPEVLQARKSGVRIVLCIGGYGAGAKEFSDTAATNENRIKFANSILNIIETYHFDGVDIDWEYPGYESPRSTAVDRANFTLLMTTIKTTLKNANEDYIVSGALPGGPWAIERYDIYNLNIIMDYIHLMTYDFDSSSKVTHHTAFNSSAYTSNGCSVIETVNNYLANGASASKLVVGAAFYGCKYTLTKDPVYSGNSPIVMGVTSVSGQATTIYYTDIYRQYINNSTKSATATSYWDTQAQAPYIYDSATRTVITFDNGASIRAKCNYVLDNDLAGIMFWDYGEDQTGILLKAIYDVLK